jgi:hypothetical protein
MKEIVFKAVKRGEAPTSFIRLGEKACEARRRLIAIYSLRFGKGSRLGQRHSLESTTLTSYFYKNNYEKLTYVYFYESIL